uniref:Apolipoprotein M n=1 Tax=Salarias fasciatus TaxID=181472 RepID=A0A672GE11_SALFA
MIALFFTVLCLIAGSHSASLGCEKLLQPLGQFDSQNILGKLAFVAGSTKDPRGVDDMKTIDSATVYFHKSWFTHVSRINDSCQYHPGNTSLDDHHRIVLKLGRFNFTGLFLHAPCPDCAVFSWNIASFNYTTTNLFLLSKRRELEQEEMEEFRAQVECLDLPPIIVMDPSKELCPEKAETEVPEEKH